MTKLALVLGLNANEVVANWTPEGVVKGFTRKYLEDHAWKFVKEEKWESCGAFFELLVRGIVLFINIDNFIDHLAVEIFLVGNLVSFVLADFYHTFHTRHEKINGTFLCCAPVMNIWMRTHMPQKVPFVSKGLTWPQRFASLSVDYVQWYKRDWETENVILKNGGH